MTRHLRHRIVVPSALMCLLAVHPAWAGEDSDVDAGVAAFEQGDHELAIRELEEALADPAALQAAHVPRARYFLGKALLAAYQAQGAPAAGPLADAPVRAADAFLAVRASGATEWAEKAVAEVEGAMMLLVIGAAPALQAPEGEGRAEILARGDAWISKALELAPGQYGLHYMRGQIRELAGRQDEAYDDYREGFARYQALPADVPDPYAALMIYSAAMITRNHRGDPAKALAEVEEGQALLKAMEEKVKTVPPEIRQAHAETTASLERARLDILLNTPDLLQQALREFEAAVQADPSDYMVLVGYATLLEHTDPAAAIAMYEKAIAVDGTRQIAHFNLGTLYFNRGSALVKEANQAEDYEAADALQLEATAEFEKARPHYENALSVSPKDKDTLGALKQLTLFLGDMEAYEGYKERFFAED